MAADARLIDAVLARIDADFARTTARLADLVRIPSVSFPNFPAEEIDRSAVATAAWLTDSGWPQVRIERPGYAPPYVIAADRRAGPQAPTLLLYAHHDVQPPLRSALWTSPAFAPEVRDGRMYGRGAADDGRDHHAPAASRPRRRIGAALRQRRSGRVGRLDGRLGSVGRPTAGFAQRRGHAPVEPRRGLAQRHIAEQPFERFQIRFPMVHRRTCTPRGRTKRQSPAPSRISLIASKPRR